MVLSSRNLGAAWPRPLLVALTSPLSQQLKKSFNFDLGSPASDLGGGLGAMGVDVRDTRGPKRAGVRSPGFRGPDRPAI